MDDDMEGKTQGKEIKLDGNVLEEAFQSLERCHSNTNCSISGCIHLVSQLVCAGRGNRVDSAQPDYFPGAEEHR